MKLFLKIWLKNINLEDIENIEGAITFDTTNNNPDEDDENSPKIAGAAIPLGSIFNMFNGQNKKKIMSKKLLQMEEKK